jgi:hypothetical protein
MLLEAKGLDAMWVAIQYVTSGLTLVAFLVAVIAWVYKSKSEERERLIQAAPEDTRPDLVHSALEFFDVNTVGLTRGQKYDLALVQIHARAQRFRTIAIVVCILAVILAGVSAYAISQTGSKLPINENGKVNVSSQRQEKPKHYQGKDNQLVSFEGWLGSGVFSYIGGSCKGCPDLERFNGTGTFKPSVLVDKPKYLTRIDFLQDRKTIASLNSEHIVQGPNLIGDGISHSLIKVDGSKDNFYGGMTSYCWSGDHQGCNARSQNTGEMMKFVSYRLNLHNYSLRVTKNDGSDFEFDLPKVTY